MSVPVSISFSTSYSNGTIHVRPSASNLDYPLTNISYSFRGVPFVVTSDGRLATLEVPLSAGEYSVVSEVVTSIEWDVTTADITFKVSDRSVFLATLFGVLALAILFAVGFSGSGEVWPAQTPLEKAKGQLRTAVKQTEADLLRDATRIVMRAARSLN